MRPRPSIERDDHHCRRPTCTEPCCGPDASPPTNKKRRAPMLYFIPLSSPAREIAPRLRLPRSMSAIGHQGISSRPHGCIGRQGRTIVNRPKNWKPSSFARGRVGSARLLRESPRISGAPCSSCCGAREASDPVRERPVDVGRKRRRAAWRRWRGWRRTLSPAWRSASPAILGGAPVRRSTILVVDDDLIRNHCWRGRGGRRSSACRVRGSPHPPITCSIPVN
jgi:hypothetical protein